MANFHRIIIFFFLLSYHNFFQSLVSSNITILSKASNPSIMSNVSEQAITGSDSITRPFFERLVKTNMTMIRLIKRIRKMNKGVDIDVDEFLDYYPVYHQFERESFERGFETALSHIQLSDNSHAEAVAMASDEFDLEKYLATNNNDERSDHGSDEEDSFEDIYQSGSEVGEITDEEDRMGDIFFSQSYNDEDNSTANVNHNEDDDNDKEDTESHIICNNNDEDNETSFSVARI